MSFFVQVNTTIEKEREHFIKYKETFKTDQDEARHVPHQRRNYTVSQVKTIIFKRFCVELSDM